MLLPSKARGLSRWMFPSYCGRNKALQLWNRQYWYHFENHHWKKFLKCLAWSSDLTWPFEDSGCIFQCLVKTRNDRPLATSQSGSQQSPHLDEWKNTWTQGSKAIDTFTVRVVVSSEPFWDRFEICSIFETGVHGQLLSNLILKELSISLVILSFVALYLPYEVAFADTQLFASLENAHIEALHFPSELLQLWFQVLHVFGFSSVLAQFPFELPYSGIDSFLFIALCVLHFSFQAILGSFSPISNIHLNSV